jgi:hypothetical protein
MILLFDFNSQVVRLDKVDSKIQKPLRNFSYPLTSFPKILFTLPYLIFYSKSYSSENNPLEVS